MVTGAVGAIILGSVYIFWAFGPIDIAVVWWGQVSVGLGIALGILALTVGAKRKKLCQFILGLGYAVLVLLQIPPTILWFAYHGSGIEREGPFVAHWGYAIPHIILLAISAFTLYSILRTLRIAITAQRGGGKAS
jgi:hypothetical protein